MPIVVAGMFLQITAGLARLGKANQVELLELCAVSDLHLLMHYLLVTNDFAPMGGKLMLEFKMLTVWLLGSFSVAH